MVRRASLSLGGLGRTYLSRRYTILFYTLFFTILAAPVLSALKFSGTLIESLLAATLVAAIMPVDAVSDRRVLLVVLAAIWLARPVTLWLEHQTLSTVTLGIWTAIGMFAAAAALRFTMGATKVDAEHLYAALSAYLLAGIYFGLLYWALEQMSPGTFVVTGKFSQTSAILFQFRHTGNTWLWRHRAACRRSTGPSDRRRSGRSALPGSFGRTTGQLVLEARERIELIVLR